jgi:hypothetical protein
VNIPGSIYKGENSGISTKFDSQPSQNRQISFIKEKCNRGMKIVTASEEVNIPLKGQYGYVTGLSFDTFIRQVEDWTYPPVSVSWIKST